MSVDDRSGPNGGHAKDMLRITIPIVFAGSLDHAAKDLVTLEVALISMAYTHLPPLQRLCAKIYDTILVLVMEKLLFHSQCAEIYGISHSSMPTVMESVPTEKIPFLIYRNRNLI